jgi:hypothetical protein
MGFRAFTVDQYSNNRWGSIVAPIGFNRVVQTNTIALSPTVKQTSGIMEAGFVPNVQLSFEVGNMGGIAGRISTDGVGVPDVRVTIDQLNRVVVTDTQGDFSFSHVVAGAYNLTASKLGYTIGVASEITVTDGNISPANINIYPIPTVSVSGTVFDDRTSLPVPAMNVRLFGYDSYQVSTNAAGQFEITGVYVNNVYTLIVSGPRYFPYFDGAVAVGTENLELEPITLKLSGIALSEDFDTQMFPPHGWFLVNASNGRNWRHNTMLIDVAPPLVGRNNSPGAAVSESWCNFDGDLTPIDNYLITPVINIPNYAKNPTLTWYVRAADRRFPDDRYSVQVSLSEFTGGTNVSGFSNLFSETLSTETNDWTHRTASLSNFIGQNIQIAFRHHQFDSAFKMLIDDIQVFYEIDDDIISDFDAIIPMKTALGGNYPNPFNPTTTIAFDLATTGNVAIEVFNIRGQKVITLANDEFTAGHHIVNWDGVDSHGRSVSSGIYFYRMTTDDFTTSRKMILMK